MKLIAHYKAKEPLKLRVTKQFAYTATRMRELAPLVGRHPESAKAYINYALCMLQDKHYHAYLDYSDLSWLPQLEHLLNIVSTGPRTGDYDHYHMYWMQTWFEHSGAVSLVFDETQLEGMAYYARHIPHFRGVSLRDFIAGEPLEVIKRKAHAALASFSAAADEAERRRDEMHLAREVRLMDEAHANELARQRAVKAYEELQARTHATVCIGDKSITVPKALLDGTGKLQRPGLELATSPQVLQGALAGGARLAEPDTVRMVGAGGIVSEFDKLPGGFIGEVRSIKIGDGPEYVVDRPGPQRPSLYDDVMNERVVFKPRAVGSSFDIWRHADKSVNFMQRYGSGAALFPPRRFSQNQVSRRSAAIMPPPPAWAPRPPSLPMALSLWDSELPHLQEWQDTIPGIQTDLSIWTFGPLTNPERARFWAANERNTLILVYYYKPTNANEIRMEVLKYSPVRGLDVDVYAEVKTYRARKSVQQMYGMNSAMPMLVNARRDFGMQGIPQGFYAAMAISVWRRNGAPFYYYQTQEANGGLQGAGGGTLEELEQGQTGFLKLLFERAI